MVSSKPSHSLPGVWSRARRARRRKARRSAAVAVTRSSAVAASQAPRFGRQSDGFDGTLGGRVSRHGPGAGCAGEQHRGGGHEWM